MKKQRRISTTGREIERIVKASSSEPTPSITDQIVEVVQFISDDATVKVSSYGNTVDIDVRINSVKPESEP